MQERFSSPLSQVLKTYDFGNFENCEPEVKLSSICTMTIGIYMKGSDSTWIFHVGLCTFGTKALVPAHC